MKRSDYTISDMAGRLALVNVPHGKLTPYPWSLAHRAGMLVSVAPEFPAVTRDHIRLSLVCMFPVTVYGAVPLEIINAGAIPDMRGLLRGACESLCADYGIPWDMDAIYEILTFVRETENAELVTRSRPVSLCPYTPWHTAADRLRKIFAEFGLT